MAESALSNLLLSAYDIDAGWRRRVRQVNEAPVYDPSDWQSVRQQMLRSPDAHGWDALVVQSVVSYREPDAAQRFFAQNSDRWAKCSNHRVTIRLNDHQIADMMHAQLPR